MVRALVNSLLMVALVAVAACTVHDAGDPGFTGPSGPVGPLTGSPPIATFIVSPSPGAVGQFVQFDASSSTPGLDASSISSYNWLFGDGDSASGRTVNHAYPVENAYAVRLTVTNNRDLSSSSIQTITINPPPDVAPPTAALTFSPAAPAVGDTVFFNASTSTAAPGHSIVSYQWTFGDGGVASGVTTSHAYATAGSYLVQVTVVDDEGQSATSSGTTVTVVGTGGGGGTASFAAFPTSPGVGESVTFNGSASRAAPGHTLVSYTWTFGDSGTGSGVTVTHAYSISGSYAVQLRVTDEIGQSYVSPVTTIQVGTTGPTSSFTFSPRQPAVGQQVVFDASSSSPPGQTIVDVAWNFGDGTAVVHCPGDPSCTSTNRISAHTYAFTGTFVVNLVVTDSANRTGSSNQQITVFPPGPTAVLNLFKSGGNTIQADGSASTATGSSTIVQYRFIWGDATADTVGTASSVSHTFAAPGVHTVTLVVTDNAGLTGATSKDITTP